MYQKPTMDTILEKLQFVEERMEALEEQLKLTKMEALEQRARAEVAETWLKIKNRKIVFMEEQEQEMPPTPTKPVETWDTIPSPSVRRVSVPSPVAKRTSLPSPVAKRGSLPSPNSVPSPVAKRLSLPSMERRTSHEEPKAGRSPKRVSLAKQCWPVIQVDADDIEVVDQPQVVKAVQGYEELILSRKENPLWTKELLREHAIHLGIEIFSKKKEQLLEDMRASIDNGAVVSNPIYILHLYEKRLGEVSLSDVNKETIEEHCKFYGIVTDGKRKNKLWDELRDIIRERPRA